MCILRPLSVMFAEPADGVRADAGDDAGAYEAGIEHGGHIHVYTMDVSTNTWQYCCHREHTLAASAGAATEEALLAHAAVGGDGGAAAAFGAATRATEVHAGADAAQMEVQGSRVEQPQNQSQMPPC